MNLKVFALPNQIEQIHNLIEGHRMSTSEAAITSQPGFGTAEVSWFGDKSAVDVNELSEIVRKVRSEVSNLSGTVVVQKCPTDLKDLVDVWGGEPSGIGVMRRLKAKYDPNNTMNPGRFVGNI